MGTEYYFKAPETFIEVSKEPGWFYRGVSWIIVTGRQDGKKIKLAITNRDENKFRDAWNALVAARSVPVGPPPKAHATHLIHDGAPMAESAVIGAVLAAVPGAPGCVPVRRRDYRGSGGGWPVDPRALQSRWEC
jgi:hypothetical protein